MILMVQHRVRDFESWKPVFDEHTPVRARHGCTGHLLYQGESDPQEVTVLLQFPSKQSAADFMEDSSLRDAMQRAGVEGEPRFSFLREGEAVDYIRRAA